MSSYRNVTVQLKMQKSSINEHYYIGNSTEQSFGDFPHPILKHNWDNTGMGFWMWATSPDMLRLSCKMQSSSINEHYYFENSMEFWERQLSAGKGIINPNHIFNDGWYLLREHLRISFRMCSVWGTLHLFPNSISLISCLPLTATVVTYTQLTAVAGP